MIKGSNILTFPTHEIVREAIQLDLFDYSEMIRQRFLIKDIKDLHQENVIHFISNLRVTAVADLRVFPTFEVPKFNQKALLHEFKSHSVTYFPAVFMRKTRSQFRDFQIQKEKFFDCSKSGTTLFIHDFDNKNEIANFRQHIFKRLPNYTEVISS